MIKLQGLVLLRVQSETALAQYRHEAAIPGRWKMVGKIGLWIDHSKAIVVSLQGERVTTRTVNSNVERRGHSKGGAPADTPYGAQDSTYEARRDRKFEQKLSQYYDQVVSDITGADAILVMGPGAAKTELRKKLQEFGVAEIRIDTEAADKLTEPQIVERVKSHYGYATRETS